LLLGVGWSPWARRAVGIDRTIPEKALAPEPVDKCTIPVDLLSAANIMRNRLVEFVSGNSVSVPGLASSAPSEFLGYFGLTEALLYTTRLYQASFALLNAHPSPFMSFLEEVETAIQESRYRGDSLMIELPRWVAYLGELVHTNLPTDHPEDPCSGSADTEKTDIFQFARLFELGLPESTENVESGNTDTVRLHNGVLMPVVGLGTWQLNGEECENAVAESLSLGYRHIDSAQAYGNEAEIGRVVSHAISQGTVTREDLFLATKLSDSEQYSGYDGVRRLVAEQLQHLQTTYIDLYMLHSPVQNKEVQAEMWRAMEDLYHEGVFRAIGVSNFDGRELTNLVNTATVRPMVVQNKLDPYHVGKQLDNRGDNIVEYARAQGIVLVAYSPFSSFPFAMQPTEDPLLRILAARYGVSPAQIIIKWAIQQGFAVIPRSSNAHNLASNLNASKLAALSRPALNLIASLQSLVSSPYSRYVHLAEPPASNHLQEL